MFKKLCLNFYNKLSVIQEFLLILRTDKNLLLRDLNSSSKNIFQGIIVKKDSAANCNGVFLWSWRDLNPRPNAELMCFLRAYSSIGFRDPAGRRRPTVSLSSQNFGIEARPHDPYSRFSYTADSRSLENTTLGRCPVPAPCAGIKLIYCTSIKQREQHCYCQLNCSMPILWSANIMAPHAYTPPLHAVKTGQPHVLWCY